MPKKSPRFSSKMENHNYLKPGSIKKAIKRRIKRLIKALNKAEEHLDHCRKWKSHKHTAELIQANFYRLKQGSTALEVYDWEIDQSILFSLDPRLKLHEEVTLRFKKAKKLEKGLPFALKQVQRIKESLEYWKNALCEFTTLELEPFKEKYTHLFTKKPSPKDPKEPKKPYIEYLSKTGVPIWIGKSAEKNEQLTFQYARGNDLWLHVANHPGSHVVIRGESPDEQTIQEAMQLALYHSKARRFKEGEVVLTQVKHVRRLGKQKGKVQIAEEKRVFVRANYSK